MNLRRHSFSALALLALAGSLSLLASCSKGQGAQGQGAQGPLEVPVRTLSTQEFSIDNSFPAVIRGEDDAEIRPKVTGFITKVFVSEGQRVRAGQPLFQLDDVTFRAAVSQASASLTSAKASLATAQLNYRNSQDLLSKNIISQSNMDEVTNALHSAEAGVAVAQANLTSARENLSFTTVVAPVAGVVGSINYRVGNLVSPQSAQALTQVSNTSQAYVYFSLSESQLSALAPGATTEAEIAQRFPQVRLRLSDGSEFPSLGTVRGVSGVVDRSTGAVSLRVDFPNAQGRLRSGAVGTIYVPTTHDNAILVPQSATVEVLHKKFVYTLGSDNKVHYTEITVSPIDDGQNYTVLTGLKAGDKIVVAGTAALSDGADVKALTEEAYKAKQEAIQKQMMSAQGQGGH